MAVLLNALVDGSRTPVVCQCALSVLFTFFALPGYDPPSPKKAENPSKNTTDRCLAVLTEQIFAQAKIKPDGHNGDIWARGLAKHGRKSARQNRQEFSCRQLRRGGYCLALCFFLKMPPSAQTPMATAATIAEPTRPDTLVPAALSLSEKE